MNKFFYNRTTARICAKKPFVVIECNCDYFGFGKFPINNCVLYSPGWTHLKTTIKAKILPLNVINDQLVTFFCSQWMSFGQNFLQLVFRQICETGNLRVFLGFSFVACWIRIWKVNADRKIGQFFAGFFHISKRRKTALQLNRTETLKPGKKKCSRHLIYARACVNKDFVHSGSIGLI